MSCARKSSWRHMMCTHNQQRGAVPIGKLEPRQAPTPTSKVSFDVNDELGHCPMAAAGQTPAALSM